MDKVLTFILITVFGGLIALCLVTAAETSDEWFKWLGYGDALGLFWVLVIFMRMTPEK